MAATLSLPYSAGLRGNTLLFLSVDQEMDGFRSIRLGSRVDRHENIGKGEIGLPVFKFIMSDKRFDNIPLILETPDDDLWPLEIKMLYKFNKN